MHLMRYFSNEQGNHRVAFTRSRPYHSDDNAHVEQKNWTHVRQLFGYERFDNPLVVELMNDLYKNEISKMNNYFLPNFKLIAKQQELTDMYNTLDPMSLIEICSIGKLIIDPKKPHGWNFDKKISKH